MKVKLLFDLDGTLSDPIEGIANAINHALEHFGHKAQPHSELGQYIGPPLLTSFAELTNTQDPKTIKGYIDKYSEHYRAIGYAQNKVYSGIAEILAELSS